MMSQLYMVYSAWLLFLFLMPIMIFFRFTGIGIELLELKGLKLTPKLLKGNIVGVSNNLEAFMKAHPSLKETNVAVKIFKNVCNDAEKGFSYNPNLYISSYKTTLQKFVLWMLLGSHIPLIFLLFIKWMPFAEIVKYQVCCYILIYILEMIIQYKHARFAKIFYTNWYNKVLNFDLLTVKLIHNDVDQIKKLSNSHDLLEVVNKFEGTNNLLSNDLSSHSKMLSVKLDELIDLQQKMNGINAQSVLLSLDDSIAKYREINAHIQVISESIRSSFESITSMSKDRKDEINVINKNTELLSDIRERFETYQSEAFKTELAQLQTITASLDNNVSKAFVSAGIVITQNFERLEEGYDKFFDMCKSLSEAVSSNYEEKTASALTLLLNGFVSEFMVMKKRMEKTTEVIEKTSQATELLCKTVYDFTQYTMSPNFMGKIGSFVSFSNKLKDAAQKLISYEKLASLGDVMAGSEKHENNNEEQT